MAKQASPTFEQIMASLKSKAYAPIYLLMGEEDYYIDRISQYAENNILTEDEKAFNLTILYGKDIASVDDVILAAKRFPMMSDYQVIIVKEAQNLKDWSRLEFYLKQPLKSTILVICYKHGKVDKRTKYVQNIEKQGILFESKRLYDNQVAGWIGNYCKERGIAIDIKAANMMAEFLGTDLSRIVNEIDKLIIILKDKGAKSITAELVEQNIGISKEYNNFELIESLVNRDILKANRIVDHFAKDPKDNPLVVTLAMLFNFYSNLLLYLYLLRKLPNDSNRNSVLASELKINPYFLKDYVKASQSYNSMQVVRIIGYIRQYDGMGKGYKSSSHVSQGDLLKELIFKILH